MKPWCLSSLYNVDVRVADPTAILLICDITKTPLTSLFVFFRHPIAMINNGLWSLCKNGVEDVLVLGVSKNFASLHSFLLKLPLLLLDNIFEHHALSLLLAIDICCYFYIRRLAQKVEHLGHSSGLRSLDWLSLYFLR